MRPSDKHIIPPKWPLKLLRLFIKKKYLEEIEGDMEERFQDNLDRYGSRKARVLYVWDSLKLLRPTLMKRLGGDVRLNHYGMFKNYFKTSYRSMSRNKLFTFINVVGLAVSMSVGLLMIAFISDLLSYDDFHEKKDRIYRVITTNQRDDGWSMNLASTSIKAGYQLRETFSGIEEVTILRRGFTGDAAIDDYKLPLEALWADHSFFDVFTYPLVYGDPATALSKPYSLVLTERSAKKLFGKTDVVGESVKFDTVNYVVTGVMQAIPRLSYFQFEALVSFSTFETQPSGSDGFQWENIFMNYVYLVLPEGRDPSAVQAGLDQLSTIENKAVQNRKFILSLQPLGKISIGNHLTNEVGRTMNIIVIWVLLGLTFIVILSACFNYANLSIARSLKRSREVGVRKVVGAKKIDVIGQFLTESIMVSMFALLCSFGLFMILKRQFISLHPYIADRVVLEPSFILISYFCILAIATGLIAGALPSLFFSRIKALKVLKGLTTFRTTGKLNLLKSLIVLQYVFSLIFINTTIIGYHQYKSFLAFDLGFETDNVLNIDLQGNKAELPIQKLSALPSIDQISQSSIVTSLGNVWSTELIYKNPHDSVSVWQNFVDENYLPLHEHTLLAGRNFEKNQHNKVIVNEQLIKSFGIGKNDPHLALGEIIKLDGVNAEIVGVIEDFHYETLEDAMQPVVFRYSADPGRYLNLKIGTEPLFETLRSIEKIWKEIDPVHPLNAKLYNDQIAHSYGSYEIMIKVIGFLAFLTIFISSIGLFGMVVFTTETKRKEISIRKVLGADEGSLIYLLSKKFLILLVVSALIALPTTYLLFEKVLLINIVYHAPIGLVQLLIGLSGVLVLALSMIGTQTLRAARINPAQILNDE